MTFFFVMNLGFAWGEAEEVTPPVDSTQAEYVVHLARRRRGR